MIAGYALFLVFVGCAVSGALVVFHATRIRFKYPDLVKDNPDHPLKLTKSFLFFKEIVQIKPEGWALSFLEKGTAERTARDFRKDLALEYMRNYIIETYLIAAKVADKLRYLIPAQTVLSFSIKILLLWLITATATVIVVPEQSKEAGTPSPPASAAVEPTP